MDLDELIRAQQPRVILSNDSEHKKTIEKIIERCVEIGEKRAPSAIRKIATNFLGLATPKYDESTYRRHMDKEYPSYMAWVRGEMGSNDLA